MDKAANWLKATLQYEFSDDALLRTSLTHRSSSGHNNERLEFLGDAILQVTISEFIFRSLPVADEGKMSRLRSALVKDQTLAEVAAEIGIGEHIVLGSGEKKAGGHRRSSILADAMEALFGAVFLDQGMDAAGTVIYRAYGNRLIDLPEGVELRDPKTRLQELLQARKLELPEYGLQKTSGKAHRQTFDVACTIATLDVTTVGQGTTVRHAEQQAAAAMLERIENLS